MVAVSSSLSKYQDPPLQTEVKPSLRFSWKKPEIPGADYFFNRSFSTAPLNINDFLLAQEQENKKIRENKNVHVVILNPDGSMGYHYIDPSNPFDIAILNRDYDQALQIAEVGLADEPNNVSLLYEKAQALRGLNKPNEAIDCFQQILSIQPKNVDALTRLTWCYEQTGDPVQAETLFMKAYRSDRHDYDLIRSIGIFYEEQGQLDDALEFYQKAYNERPDSIEVCTDLARLYEKQGSYEQALKFNEKILSFKPTNPHEAVWKYNFKHDSGFETIQDVKAHFENLEPQKHPSYDTGLSMN